MYELYIKSIIHGIRAYRHNVIHSFIVFLNDKLSNATYDKRSE